MVGEIDVASDQIESAEDVAADKLLPCTNCGIAPLKPEVALGKLRALADGAGIVSREVSGA